MRTSSKEHRQLHLSSFELPFVEKFHPRERSCGQGYSTFLRQRERCRCTRLVVILNEAKQLLLVRESGTQMQPDVLCVRVLKAVVKCLVVAKIKALLLEFPLQIPIRLRNEQKTGARSLHVRNDICPILCSGFGACTRGPGASEDRVQEQHCHVTAH